MNLISILKQHAVAEGRRPRFRDRRGHYASSALSCLRDQYWAMTGEKETDPSDFIGTMKMLVGSAIEAGLVKELLSDLHWYGIHLRGTQVYVGGSNPSWDGALDALVWTEKDGHYVLEIKTKSGFGADLLWEKLDLSPEYMAQLGLYLSDLHAKGITNRGALLYVLLSDKHFGDLIQVHAEYDAETDRCYFSHAIRSDGTERTIGKYSDLKPIRARWLELDRRVATKECPPKGDYQYKYPLTPEFLATVSDAQLRKAASGEAVLGDWQPKYSRYKSKALKVDGTALGYTDEELAILKQEYRRRHPKSKI